MNAWNIIYLYNGKVQQVEIIAESYKHAKRQFYESNNQFNNIMTFIDAERIV